MRELRDTGSSTLYRRTWTCHKCKCCSDCEKVSFRGPVGSFL